VKTLYNEKYKIMKKELKKIIEYGMTSCVHGLEELIL
jgi:hypothetical protein